MSKDIRRRNSRDDLKVRRQMGPWREREAVVYLETLFVPEELLSAVRRRQCGVAGIDVIGSDAVRVVPPFSHRRPCRQNPGYRSSE